MDHAARTPRRSYQAIAVPGEAIAGQDRSYLNAAIFDERTPGASVLDIGCYLGYFCLEALRRGAAAATGIEPDLECVEKARALARDAGLPAEYLVGDFETWDWGGRRFDVVLCLNVLHHMYDPVHALRRIMALARRKVVLEFAAPRRRDLLKSGANPLAFLAGGLPAILLGAPRRTEDAAAQSFLFTAKAMEVLFNRHTKTFEPVRITPSPFKGRLVLEARRREIGHLVVITGPTGSGKSTLMRRLAADAAWRARLGLEPGPWLETDAHVKNLPGGRVDRALMHYDLLRPWGRSIKAYGRDPGADVFAEAERLDVLTLMVEPNRLRDQLARAELSGAKGRKRRRQAEAHARYADPAFLLGWYDQWFAFLERFGHNLGSNLLVVRRSHEDEVLPASGWRAIYDELQRAA
jgi:2-polyprenyl-3-methyl-5-hydroxy-6-metoxy-1,4-benzoquinol methylase